MLDSKYFRFCGSYGFFVIVVEIFFIGVEIGGGFDSFFFGFGWFDKGWMFRIVRLRRTGLGNFGELGRSFDFRLVFFCYFVCGCVYK